MLFIVIWQILCLLNPSFVNGRGKNLWGTWMALFVVNGASPWQHIVHIADNAGCQHLTVLHYFE